MPGAPVEPPIAPFVGRGREREALTDAWRRATEGDARVVLVRGEPGTGKTALVTQWLRETRPPRVLWARATEDETTLPYAVLEQLLRAGPGPPALPILGDAATAGAELLALLGDLQTGAPLVAVVDDLQWADLVSVQAIVFAVRRLRTDRVLAILTSRAGDRQRLPLAQRLVELGRGEILDVGALAREDVAALAGAAWEQPVSAAVSQRLWEHTEGHALYTVELLRGMRPTDVVATVLPAPPRLAALAQDRLAACSPTARDLVIASAVVGVPVPLSILTTIADAPPEPLHALDEAVCAGLLQVHTAPQGMQVSIPHPLTRGAIYYGLSIEDRVRLHTSAAKLADDQESALEHRKSASLGPDRRLAADLARYGRDRARLGAWRAATASLAAAAEITPETEVRRAILLDAVECCLNAGDAEAANRLMSMTALPMEGARSTWIRGSLALIEGRFSQAVPLLEATWDAAKIATTATTTISGQLAARAARELSHICVLTGQPRVGVLWARRAAESAGTTAGVAGTLGMNLMLAGQAAEAAAVFTDIPETQHPDAERLDDLIERGVVRLFSDDLRGARRDLRAVALVGRDLGDSRALVHALGNLAEVEHRLGEWNASASHADQALSAAVDSGQSWAEALLHAQATPVLARRGQWQAAAAHVRAAASASLRSPYVSNVCHSQQAAARLAHAQRDYPAVLAAREPLITSPTRSGLDEPGVFDWRELHLEALIRLGRLADAERALSAFEELARRKGRRSAQAGSARCRGLLQRSHGDLRGACASLGRSVALYNEVAMPFEHAYSQLLLGETIALGGGCPGYQAEESLRSAESTFLRLGADPCHDLTRALLAEIGAQAAGLRPPPAALTPQELAVARLVATGLTNREVARDLVISVKAVEYHLGNIYRKLQISSRTKLALWWQAERSRSDE